MTAAASKKTHRYSLACLAAFAASAVTATAFAGAPTVVSATPQFNAAPSVKVRYDDLNMATENGTATLYRRIVSAARQVCPDQYSRNLKDASDSRKCQATAIARAVQDVNSPQLALVHATHINHG
ncbi:MAG: UrcA family protein [Steroidobacteraceae bacterium]